MSRRYFQFVLALSLACTAAPILAQHGGAPGGSSGSGPGAGNRSGGAGSSGGPIVNEARPMPNMAAGVGSNGLTIQISHGVHQLGLAGRWWDDSRTARSLGLRSEQQKRMDQIFESSKPQLVGLYSNLQQEQQRLSSMPSKDLTDDTKVYSAIDHVTQARADLEKATTQIYSQIRQQLDSDQQARLDDAITKQR